MSATLPSPVPTSQFGFTSKAWIAYQLEEIHLGGIHYVWFSTELNPIANGESSNPLQLYSDIDIAVKKKDVNHSKLKDLRANLLLVVSRLIGPRDRTLSRALQREIRTAPVEMFRPQIWRIDLRKVDASRWKKDGAHSGWDEQYVTDLKAPEFEVLVE
jgi:hypothetical protein